FDVDRELSALRMFEHIRLNGTTRAIYDTGLIGIQRITVHLTQTKLSTIRSDDRRSTVDGRRSTTAQEIVRCEFCLIPSVRNRRHSRDSPQRTLIRSVSPL